MSLGVRYDWRDLHWQGTQGLTSFPRLAVAEIPHSECVSVCIYIPVGTRDEVDLPAGLAHFLEHMTFKGTTKRAAKQISIDAENVGAQLNASTSEDQTIYEGRGEASTLEVILDVLTDMVWGSILPAEELELEREVIREEIIMYYENPSDYISDVLSKALWAPHPLGNAIAGTQESIDQINRDQLLAFRDHHYFGNDWVIAIAGPFTIDKVESLLIPHLPQNVHARKARIPFDAATWKSRSIAEARDTDQLQLALAWHTPSRHSPHDPALRLLSVLLGENSSSRLFLKLREEMGLCYHVSTGVTFFEDTGVFEISLGLDQASRDEAIQCILAEIHSILKEGVTEEELTRAKRLMITQSKLSLETTDAHASWIGDCLLDYGTILNVEEWRARWLSITPESIQAAAQSIFMDQSPIIAEITNQPATT